MAVAIRIIARAAFFCGFTSDAMSFMGSPGPMN
jgi:hypothetical protein